MLIGAGVGAGTAMLSGNDPWKRCEQWWRRELVVLVVN